MSFSCALARIRQLQFLEQGVEVLLGADGEAELVLAFAVGRALGALVPLPRLRLGQGVAAHEFLVAGQHLVAVAALRGVAQARLGDPLHRDADDFLALDVTERRAP
ncbi:MAG: hypothetical protein WDM85_12990 [Caulobacteraceae bacterium]